MVLNPKLADGPIPGENFTSDTRNYPWHRPPEITDMDQAIEASVKQLTKKDQAYTLLTLLQAGVTVVQASDMFVTSGIATGKWTPDFAILLAGPVSHIIKMMADEYGIKYDMGLKDSPAPTIEFLKAKAEVDPRRVVTVADKVQDSTEIFKAQEPEQVNPMGGPFENGPLPQAPQSGLMGMSGPEAEPTEGMN